MNLNYLKQLGFIGPYSHGEYYLYDESCKKEIIVSGSVCVDDINWHWVKYRTLEDWCCVMCVYPPTEEQKWTASYNSQRGMWCSDGKYYDSGWIEFKEEKELDELLIKSRALG